VKKAKKRRTTKTESFPIIRAFGFEVTFPDLITALNLCAGVAAIFSAIKGETLIAVVLVGAGMVFDYFDGKIARVYKLAHDFGRELDSLADLVTFGIAPGVILLSLFPGDDFILSAAALYAVAAAFRLARFNLLKGAGKAEQTYIGMPVPVAAFLVLLVSLPHAVGFSALIMPGKGLALVTLVAAALMLSLLKFPKL